MVEKEYPGLTSKKYCNEAHISKIEYLCTKEGILCCADCAADHSEHFEKVEDIKSIFEAKLSNYRKLTSKLKILATMQNSPDEIRSYIGQMLESSFDQIIARVADMKKEWIEEHFQRIMESLNVDIYEEKVPDLTQLTAEVEETYKKIHNYIASTDVNSEEVMKLKQPEEFEPQIDQILQSSNKRKKYKDIKITLNFDPESLRRMINIEGYSSPIPYEGSLLDKNDLEFTLSLFPTTPIKELKMLFSGRRDGMEASVFHSKCDGHGDTLTVMKGNGHIFGGYAKPQWSSAGVYIADNTKSSFLFTCRSRTKHPLTSQQNTIYVHSDYGPTFGGGHDIQIDNTGRNGYNHQHSYSIPEGGNKENSLAGTTTANAANSVTYEDYEVHQVIFQ